MTEDAETPTPEPTVDGDSQQAAPPEQQAAAWVPEPLPPPSAQESVGNRPELMMGAAFAAGLLGAMILKRLAR